MAQMITITDTLELPRREVRFRFARSGGPGGQNVNKVETRVELLFDVQNSTSLSDEQRTRILHHLRNVIDSDGILHVSSQESRSQWKNRETAVEKLREMLRRALQPRKKRIATKISKGAKVRRLETKKHRGKIKRLRKFDAE